MNNQENVINLLRNKSKNKMTFKQIAEITSYHPKSLIRLNSKIEHNHFELNLKPRMQKNEKNYITHFIKSCSKSPITEIYKKYCTKCNNDELYPLRSYSQIYKLAKENKINAKSVPNSTFIFQIFRINLDRNNSYIYCILVIDYDIKKLLGIYFIRTKIKTLHVKLLNHIIEKYHKPENIYVYGSHVIRAPMYGNNIFSTTCKELNIKEIHKKNPTLYRYFLKIKKNIKEMTKQFLNKNALNTEHLRKYVINNIKI
jgi:phage anti-repressor protein